MFFLDVPHIVWSIGFRGVVVITSVSHAGSSPAGNRVSRVCILENPIAGPSEVMVGAHNSRYPGFKGLWGI